MHNTNAKEDASLIDAAEMIANGSSALEANSFGSESLVLDSFGASNVGGLAVVPATALVPVTK